ncbi:MAG: hypothetical protein ACYTFK_11035 [Planctomycetota bacterium]|jgi:hypothetical protein
MNTPKSSLKVGALLLCLCGVIVWFGSRTEAADKIFKIHPETTLEGYKSDAVRIMDAYERLMDRYMSLVEGSLTGMGTDVDTAVKKLNSIEKKIDNLGKRIGRIEKAMNIPQPGPGKKTAAQKTKK